MLGARSYFPLMLPANDTLVYSNARAYPLVSQSTLTTCALVPYMTISIVNGVNPLQTTLLELGIVSGRVALLLRSAEIQPVFGRFSLNGFCHSPSSPWWEFATGGLCMLYGMFCGQVLDPPLMGLCACRSLGCLWIHALIADRYQCLLPCM